MRLTYLLTLAFLALPSGCGENAAEDETDETSTAGGTAGAGGAAVVDPTTDPHQDSKLAAGVIAIQFDEAVSYADADVPSQGASLRLSPEFNAVSDATRNCEEEDGVATVTITKDFSGSFSRLIGQITRTISLDVESERVRTWSKEDATLSCDDSESFVDLSGVDMEGVTLGVTLDRERERTVSFSRGTFEISATRSFASDATKTVAWTSDESTDTLRTLRQSVTGTTDMSMTLPNQDDDLVTLTTSISVAEEDPFIIELVRQVSDGAWVSRTIESGKMVSVYPNGRRLEEVYEDVKLTAEGQCYPTSGEIQGSLYLTETTTTATSTYTITFGSSSIVIDFSDGSQEEFSPEGCELDDEDSA